MNLIIKFKRKKKNEYNEQMKNPNQYVREMCVSRLTDNYKIQIFIKKNYGIYRRDKALSAMSARTSEGNSAQRRSHMKMALRHMKCRKLLCTESTSMASIGEERRSSIQAYYQNATGRFM